MFPKYKSQCPPGGADRKASHLAFTLGGGGPSYSPLPSWTPSRHLTSLPGHLPDRLPLHVPGRRRGFPAPLPA